MLPVACDFRAQTALFVVSFYKGRKVKWKLDEEAEGVDLVE